MTAPSDTDKIMAKCEFDKRKSNQMAEGYDGDYYFNSEDWNTAQRLENARLMLILEALLADRERLRRATKLGLENTESDFCSHSGIPDCNWCKPFRKALALSDLCTKEVCGE